MLGVLLKFIVDVASNIVPIANIKAWRNSSQFKVVSSIYKAKYFFTVLLNNQPVSCTVGGKELS
jgi:hypothetical protein